MAREINPPVSYAYPYKHQLTLDLRNQSLLYDKAVLAEYVPGYERLRDAVVVPGLVVCLEGDKGRLAFRNALLVATYKKEDKYGETLFDVDVRSNEPPEWFSHTLLDVEMWP
jgi:hypothetical protein